MARIFYYRIPSDLTVNVLKNEESIATERESHTTNITIGNPKTLCWPSSGNVWQLPNGPISHKKLQALDVALKTGQPVYTPVNGTIEVPEYSDSYGYYSIVHFDADNSCQNDELIIDKDGNSVPDGIPACEESQFWFGHSPTRDSIPFNSFQRVSIGDRIGLQGSSGYSIDSDGNIGTAASAHLHWELRSPFSTSIYEFIKEGSSVFVGQTVTSCFD